MTIKLTPEGMRAIFPRAPQSVIEAFVEKQAVLDRAGITHTRTRLAYFFANIEHECGGFTIPNLTENTNYTPPRIAQVWPNRYKSAAAVIAKFGNPIDKVAFFNEVYGNRMGNRPGSNDGWDHIGRGGPQITGRDGYAAVAKASQVPIDTNVQFACSPTLQPEICAGFWTWKNMNRFADAGDFNGAVRAWNGGTNGMADRLHQMSGNNPIITRLETVNTVAMPTAKTLPGSPPTPKPPKDVVDATTTNERKSRAGGVAGGVVGAANEGAKQTGTIAPDKAPMSSTVSYVLIGVAVAVIVVATILIARKKAAVIKNWF